MQLQRGEKRSLSNLGIGSKCSVKVDFGLDGVDITAFGLNQAKQIGDDRYVVLFSNIRSPEGAIQINSYSDTATFDIDLNLLPDVIQRIVFTATHDTRPVSQALSLIVKLDGNKATFNVAEHLTTEKAVMMLELYRHSGEWKVGTIAAGFDDGLPALIAHFGGTVADTPASMPTSDAMPGVPSVAPAPVSLKKITLEKSSPTVSLKKTAATFGEIVVHLNWNQAKGRRALFRAPKNIDLDLGVLYELNTDGRGVIQSLGNAFGCYDNNPWIELSGDDRTGATTGETIRVNGKYFDRIKRIAVFALIYDGVPNWQQTDGIVCMNIPGQPEIEVRMTEGRNDYRLCGIAIIENVGRELRIQRHMQYYRDQQDFADDIGIYLRWKAGRKD
ncbi:TerD family protein [Beijerinckia mobilis]|uniref:TerD family protein n=1 Tax=Beijerinckia mobilis TaxID=231434 RepID=UPI000550BC7A|nr:TerD family protein [Beijerinckia mobilis]